MLALLARTNGNFRKTLSYRAAGDLIVLLKTGTLMFSLEDWSLRARTLRDGKRRTIPFEILSDAPLTSRSSLVFLVVAKTLLCRFFRWRTSSSPKPRLPPMTRHDPGSGGKVFSSAEEDAIILARRSSNKKEFINGGIVSRGTALYTPIDMDMATT